MAGMIEDYAVVGDLETAALISRDGAIDWLCVPRFDSPACFAALLGGPGNGYWRIAPVGRRQCNRRSYRGDTLVLDSIWDSVDGAVSVTDFMPPRADLPHVVRIVEGLSGTVAMRGEVRLRFNHGRVVPWTRTRGTYVVSVAGPDSAWLSADQRVDVRATDDCTYFDFTVREGETLAFMLSWSPSHMPVPPLVDPATALLETLDFWERWTAKCRYQGPWRDAVVRSLITLKALTYAPTGGIVAAATTSLPESIGGERNWDYRFCWLRDSTLTLSCLLRSGFREEAVSWTDWLLRAIAGDPADLQTLYGVAGQRRLPEESSALWLPGYEGSEPVRFGNAAVGQFQLDVYGEVLDALYMALRSGVPMPRHVWRLVDAFMSYLEEHWREPDEGLWEVRGPRRQFVHSKIMCWVAADRALRMWKLAGRTDNVERWRAMRTEVHREVCRDGWNEEKGSFVQYYGAHVLDASALLIPRVGFLPVHDPRVLGTVEAVRTLDHHGFLRRYASRDHEVNDVDGLRGSEGAFLACSMWMADALAVTGRQDEARAVFERVLDVRNDVGLLSEEWDPVTCRQLGNTPQAFSHIALVNTAFTLREAAQGHHPAEE
ncbi:glycoside hydrolase family 15 protein [Streptomyces sp. NPDC029004]|uniref:glycoside hydrolase family 15 protein n=1 Tax=Streptomyces sp. NPDC029004 TaxID=3154490 RepID=UPI0033D0C8B8